MTWVVDANVALKWVIPEMLSDQADRILAGDMDILAPDLLRIEAANMLWRKTMRGEMSTREADDALELLTESGALALHPSGPLLGRAVQIARQIKHPVYDCMYVALAEREQAMLVTADRQMIGRCRTARRLKVSVVHRDTL